ncbi:MAG TPA: HAMP domain-containing sensor histidine kinase [Candidatus Limnocylindrales bacterium]|nr:HAMP domain-containing sensor histidine kinase [Candidatus Limnocylindrales bacterium]
MDARLMRDVRWRLVLWSGLSTLLVLAILGVALYWSAARTLESNGVRQLTERTSQIVDALENPRGRPNGPQYGFIFGGNSSGTFAIALDADGNNIGRGVSLPTGLPVRESLDAAVATGTDVRPATIGALPIRAMTERVTTPIGDVFIQVIQDRTAEQRTLDTILQVLLLGGAVVVLVAVAFGAVYARRALVPIRESLASQRGALRRQREFAADASHELRTPLTVIRSSVEHLRRNQPSRAGSAAAAASSEALDDIDAEVGHLTALVEDLLLLARSDSGTISVTPIPVDLGDVAADAAGALVKLAGDRGIRLGLDPEPAIVRGDQARLRQLVVILVDNAIRHTPRGGAVSVRVRATEREAILDVDDDGPGIRTEDMPRVFERFWRAPGSAGGGTGLGLAIAKSIVDLHHGRITVGNRPEGGARFTVQLPVDDTPPSAPQPESRRSSGRGVLAPLSGHAQER